MASRYWLLQARLLTSQEMKQAKINPLRAVDLGRCGSLDQARKKAKPHLGQEPSLAMARNVRLACDSGQGAKWGLTANQIARLRLGEIIQMEDTLGRFKIGYAKLENQ